MFEIVRCFIHSQIENGFSRSTLSVWAHFNGITWANNLPMAAELARLVRTHLGIFQFECVFQLNNNTYQPIDEVLVDSCAPS